MKYLNVNNTFNTSMLTNYRQLHFGFWTHYLPQVVGNLVPTYEPTTEVKKSAVIVMKLSKSGSFIQNWVLRRSVSVVSVLVGTKRSNTGGVLECLRNSSVLLDSHWSLLLPLVLLQKVSN
jgi:hypothetical protein